MKNLQLPVILAVTLNFSSYVYATDTIPPSCEATFVGYNANGEKIAQFTANDNEDDVVQLNVNNIVNARFTIHLSTEPVVFIATKIDQSKKAVINAVATDAANNTANCSESIMMTINDDGKSDKKIYPRLPQAAGKIHVQNAHSGIQKLKIKVNDNTPQEVILSNGEYKVIDVSSEMDAGDNNRIAFKGEGYVGTNAYIIMLQ
jgi:GTP:adenosylcobinamide-phosphate guanylyltransferase